MPAAEQLAFAVEEQVTGGVNQLHWMQTTLPTVTRDQVHRALRDHLRDEAWVVLAQLPVEVLEERGIEDNSGSLVYGDVETSVRLIDPEEVFE